MADADGDWVTIPKREGSDDDGDSVTIPGSPAASAPAKTAAPATPETTPEPAKSTTEKPKATAEPTAESLRPSPEVWQEEGTPQSYLGAQMAAGNRGLLTGTGDLISSTGRGVQSGQIRLGSHMIEAMNKIDQGDVQGAMAPLTQVERGMISRYIRATPEVREGMRLEETENVSRLAARPGNAATRAGEAVREYGEKNNVVAIGQEGFGTKVSEGAGAMLPVIAGAAVAGAVGGPPAALAVALPMIGGQTYESTRREALSKGASPDDAERAAGINALTQMGIMSLPVGHVFRMVPEVAPSVAKALIEIGKRSGEFAMFSAAGKIADNIVAQKNFDPKRDLFEGVAEATAVGAVTGGAMATPGATRNLPRRGFIEMPKPSTSTEVGPFTGRPAEPPVAEEVAQARPLREQFENLREEMQQRWPKKPDEPEAPQEAARPGEIQERYAPGTEPREVNPGPVTEQTQAERTQPTTAQSEGTTPAVQPPAPVESTPQLPAPVPPPAPRAPLETPPVIAMPGPTQPAVETVTPPTTPTEVSPGVTIDSSQGGGYGVRTRDEIADEYENLGNPGMAKAIRAGNNLGPTTPDQIEFLEQKLALFKATREGSNAPKPSETFDLNAFMGPSPHWKNWAEGASPEGLAVGERVRAAAQTLVTRMNELGATQETAGQTGQTPREAQVLSRHLSELMGSFNRFSRAEIGFQKGQKYKWATAEALEIERSRVLEKLAEISGEPAPTAPVGQSSTVVPPTAQYAEMLPPDRMKVAPEVFQYKASDEKGVTGRLTHTNVWEPDLADPVTAWQDKSGQLWIADGHQRHDLATRAVAAGQQDVLIPTRILREEDGYSPEFVKVLAAYRNIDAGSGTPIDAAKIFRAPDVAAPPGKRLPTINMQGVVARTGRSLSKLSDEVFGAVVNGVVKARVAAPIGDLISDPAEQMAALKVLIKEKPPTEDLARIIVQDVRDSGYAKKLADDQGDIFGSDPEYVQSYFGERAQVLNLAKQRLRDVKRVLKTAVEGEETLAGAGNVLDREGNIKGKTENEQLLDLLERNATLKGPISEALTASARSLAEGKAVGVVAGDFLTQVRGIVRRGEGERIEPRSDIERNGPEGEAPEGPVEGQGGFFSPVHDAEWQRIVERGAEVKRQATAYAEAGLPARFRDKYGITYLVSKDLNYPPDGWRVTMFGKDGQPTGHWEANNAYDAFREVLAGEKERIGPNHQPDTLAPYRSLAPRAGGMAPMRTALNNSRVGVIRRGPEAMINRLRLQANLDRSRQHADRPPSTIHPDEIREVDQFIQFIGEHMFTDVGLRILQHGHGAAGQYDPMSHVVSLFRAAIDNGSVPHTMVHELWHSLERTLPREDRLALAREFHRQRERWFRDNPGMREFMDGQGQLRRELTDLNAVDWITRHGQNPEAMRNVMVTGEGTANPRVRMRVTRENYRYTNLSEYFAETMTDRHFNEMDIQDAVVRSIWSHFRDIFRRFIQAIQRLFGRDASGRIYEGYGARQYAPGVENGMLANTPGSFRSMVPDKVPLYSGVERAVDGLKQTKGTGEQMLAQITKAAGVKPEEVKWMNLAEWLRGQKTVTKEQIADYVRANQIEVKETQYGGAPDVPPDLAPLRESVMKAEDVLWKALPNPFQMTDGTSMTIEDLRWKLRNAPFEVDLNKLPDKGQVAADLVLAAYDRLNKAGGPRPPRPGVKWGSYMLPGGTKFELAFSLPVKEVPGVSREAIAQQFFGRPFSELSRQQVDEVATELHFRRKSTAYRPDIYQSGHWNIPNVVAHGLYSERIHPVTGKRQLMADEMQSDQHQTGRKEGYRDPEFKTKAAEIQKKLDDLLDQVQERHPELDRETDRHWQEQYAYKKMTPAEREQHGALTKEYAALERIQDYGVPDAPFKTTWPALVMKRAIKWAVDNGFDEVVWSHGEVIAKRYSEDNGGPKDQARLKGMQGFYDKIMPETTQKIVGKYGVKVGKSEIKSSWKNQDEVEPDAKALSDHKEEWDRTVAAIHEADRTGDEADDRLRQHLEVLHTVMVNETMARGRIMPVHSIEITPALRKAVQEEGLSLFAGKGPREPTIRNDPNQVEMPGMRPSAAQAQIARDQTGTGRLTKPNQKAADEGLFAPRVEQAGLFDPRAPAAPVSRWAEGTNNFTDELHMIPNLDASHAGAIDFVFQRGRETGLEHMAVVENSTGRIVHAGTIGKEHQVSIDENSMMGAPDGFTIHHNHPNYTAGSAGDVGLLAAPGLKDITVVTPDGNTFTLSLARDRDARSADPYMFNGLRNTLIKEHRDIQKEIEPIFVPGAVKAGMEGEEAAVALTDIVNRILHSRGVINYTSTYKPPEWLLQDLRERGYVLSDRYTDAVGTSEQIAELQSGVGKHPETAPTGGAGSTERGGPLLDPSGQARLFEGIDRAFTLEAGKPIKDLVKWVNDQESYTDKRDALINFIAPLNLGPKETSNNAFNFANTIRQGQRQFGQIAQMIRDTFTLEERWQIGRALAEQSVFERKLARELDMNNLTPFQRATLESNSRTRWDGTQMGIEGLGPKGQALVASLKVIQEKLWDELKAREMVDPNAEGWAYWMPRQLVIMEPGKKARRIVKDDSILPGSSGRNKPGAIPTPDMHPFGTNMTTDVPGFRDYEEIEATLRAARAKYGPNVQLVDDIVGLVGSLERINAAIAGHDLIQSIVDYGNRVGERTALLGGSGEKGFYLPGHRSMYKVGPKFVTENGKTVVAQTPSGQPVFEKQPIWIHEDFRPALDAVFRAPSGDLMKAFMTLKAWSTHFVMQSPLIHLQVELGRAMPLVAGRQFVVAQMGAGRRARMAGDPRIDLLVKHGMAPVMRGFIGDPSALMNEFNYKSKFGRLGEEVNNARVALAKLADKGGHDAIAAIVRHPINSLLWNRVMDLQIAIGLTVAEDRIKAGWHPTAAYTVAAHLANRYAGALPPEAMSRLANNLLQMFLFSRSFTGGNLGVMKDAITGGSNHVINHIEIEAGPEAAKQARSWMRGKSQKTFAYDILLAWGFLALVQHASQALNNWANDVEPEESIVQGYVRRFHEAWHYATENPISSIMLPPLVISRLLPSADNEPGKENRSRIMPLGSSPQWLYFRTPLGKVGEEFLDWIMDPFETLSRKQSTIYKGIHEAFVTGKDSFGHDIVRPGHDHRIENTGRRLKHFAGAVFPIELEKDVYTALGNPGGSILGAPPTRKERILAGARVVLNLTGFGSLSRGYPYGPVAGANKLREDQIKFDAAQVMPEVARLVNTGNPKRAVQMLVKAGEDPSRANKIVNWLDPRSGNFAADRSTMLGEKRASHRGDVEQLDRNAVLRRSYGLTPKKKPATPLGIAP